MTTKQECPHGGPTKSNWNCTVPGPDGLPVQCVGPWAQHKHDYLARYFAATAGVRTKFLKAGKYGAAGGAAFIDLFAGPGRARVRTTGEIIAGSPLLAADARAPFTHLVCAECEPENLSALRMRLAPHETRTTIVAGDCNQHMNAILSAVPREGLNIALLDPYGLRDLTFATLERLAAFPRMDLILHFPIMDIRRNFDTCATDLTRFLGTNTWRSRVRSVRNLAPLLVVLREQLSTLGYQPDAVRTAPVKNTQRRILYHLVYATKHALGNKIWDSLLRTDPGGQKDLPFPDSR